MKQLLSRLFTTLALLAFPAGAALAQEVADAAAPAPASPIEAGSIFGMTWAQILEFGGSVLWLIIGLSVIALAYILWLFPTMRVRRAVPERFAQEVLDLIHEGNLLEAESRCDARSCEFAAVAKRAIAFCRSTPHADPVLLKEVIAGEGSTQAAKIVGRPQRLTHVISIAPMLGLLGTVIGMLASFISIAGDVAAAKPVLLAQGMAKAIITTIAGLVVAIVTSVFYAWFTSRAEAAVYRLSATADDLLTALLTYQQTR